MMRGWGSEESGRTENAEQSFEESFQAIQDFIFTPSLLQLDSHPYTEAELLELVRNVVDTQSQRLLKALKKLPDRPDAIRRLAQVPWAFHEAFLQALIPTHHFPVYKRFIANLHQQFLSTGRRQLGQHLLEHAYHYFASPQADPPAPAAYLDSWVAYLQQATAWTAARAITETLRLASQKSEFIDAVFLRELTRLNSQHFPNLNIDAPKESQERPEKEPESVETTELQPVSNAGLALVFAILPSILKSVGYLDERGNFPSKATRIRAAHWLKQLARPAPVPENEDDDHLVGLLVGLKPEEVNQLEPPLTKEEIRMSNATLEAVLEAWSGMEQMGIDAFRQEWLLRTGDLEEQAPGYWILRLDPRATDHLLDRLPWPCDHFAASWTQTTIQVRWN